VSCQNCEVRDITQISEILDFGAGYILVDPFRRPEFTDWEDLKSYIDFRNRNVDEKKKKKETPMNILAMIFNFLYKFKTSKSALFQINTKERKNELDIILREAVVFVMDRLEIKSK